MSFILETVKNGKDRILYNNNKYRESYTVKNGDLVWRCLGKVCKAQIRTNPDKNVIYLSDEKHNGPHPVTMRALTPTPPQQRHHQLPTMVKDSPPLSVSTPVLDTSSSETCLTLTTPVTSFVTPATPEDQASEIFRLKKEIARLKEEMQTILDHTIESDKRLLQYTDQIFVVNSPISLPHVNQATHACSLVDCSVQCDLMPSSNLSVHAASKTDTRDISVQCDAPAQPKATTILPDDDELITSLRTTVEVLGAENNCLKLELQNCACKESNQAWQEVKTKKKKVHDTNYCKPEALNNENKIPNKFRPRPVKKGQSYPNSKQKPNKSQKFRKTPVPVYNPNIKSILIKGDSHTRHLARLVGDRIGHRTSVSGICKPGARLLNIVDLNRTAVPPVPGPGLHCEVLIAGSNDVAVGAQRNIYRHFEDIITARSATTKLVVATLPHRHDVHDPADPVHEEIVLVNAFIEKLATRHNIPVLNLDRMDRKYFTTHGQHLSKRGKRLLADMVVRSLSTESRRPVRTPAKNLSPPSSPGPFTLRYDTYAEAVTSSRPVVLQPPTHEDVPSPLLTGTNIANIVNSSVLSFLGTPTQVNGEK